MQCVLIGFLIWGVIAFAVAIALGRIMYREDPFIDD